jgi:hypothetical protein
MTTSNVTVSAATSVVETAKRTRSPNSNVTLLKVFQNILPLDTAGKATISDIAFDIDSRKQEDGSFMLSENEAMALEGLSAYIAKHGEELSAWIEESMGKTPGRKGGGSKDAIFDDGLETAILCDLDAYFDARGKAHAPRTSPKGGAVINVVMKAIVRTFGERGIDSDSIDIAHNLEQANKWIDSTPHLYRQRGTGLLNMAANAPK